jgi:hypothetical protein
VVPLYAQVCAPVGTFRNPETTLAPIGFRYYASVHCKIHLKDAAANVGNNCVWAVAHICNSESGRGRFWATHSAENVVQVIGGAIEGRLGGANLRDRWAINEKIADYVGRQGLGNTVGQAEELLIMAWDYMIGYHAIRYNGENPNTVTLYLSDSPCTIHDGRKKSDNIPGKPPSCLAKINLLMKDKTSITSWAIYYRKPWGILQQKKRGKLSQEAWDSVQTGQALILDNPVYKKFTEEMERMAVDAGL